MGVCKIHQPCWKGVAWQASAVMLGADPLPQWLRSLARGSVSKMVSQYTFDDKFCLWHCIAVFQGVRPDRSTQAVRELVKSFLKLRIMQNDFVKTSLGDELDKVERHLNQGKQFSDWLGIRVYDPKRQENDEIQWHLKKNPSNKLKNIRTIRFIKGTRFSSNIWTTSAKLYRVLIAESASQKLVTCNGTQPATESLKTGVLWSQDTIKKSPCFNYFQIQIIFSLFCVKSLQEVCTNLT